LKGKQDRRQNGRDKSPKTSKIRRRITIRKRIKSTIKIKSRTSQGLLYLLLLLLLLLLVLFLILLFIFLLLSCVSLWPTRQSKIDRPPGRKNATRLPSPGHTANVRNHD